MRLKYVATCAAMTVKEISRQRVALALALLVPAVFFGVVFLTSGDRALPVTLAAAAEPVTRVAGLRLSLVFISIAAAGLVSAFFAASLVQRQFDGNRRLALCGYRASELIAARLAVLLGIIAFTALYAWLLLTAVARPAFPLGVPLGIALGAFVYGCYGLLVGTIFRRETEAVFAILILINIDAGWLQNPVYYEPARRKWLIEALPAYFPAQVAYLAAFTQESVAGLAAWSLVYGSALALAALVLYSLRMRVSR
ncbi:MAG: hypothetical protein ABI610_06220 [Acidobacteriota bacterium]